MEQQERKITLYGYYRSSTSYRTRIVLNLKHLEYENVSVRLDQGGQTEERFLQINPMGAVPALVLDGHTFLQSSAIINLLEEQFPTPALLPKNFTRRQRVREICDLIGSDIHPVNNLRVLKYLRATHKLDDEKINSWYRHWVQVGFSALETMLTAAECNGQFCVGSSVSLADAYLIPQVYNARRFNVDFGAFPLIKKVDAYCQSLSAFALAAPERQPDAPDQA